MFLCSTTQSHSKLEDREERNSEGKITSRRQREVTNVRQLRCLWSAFRFFRSTGKRGSEEKGYVLTMQNTTHEADDSFALSAPNEFHEAYRLAVKVLLIHASLFCEPAVDQDGRDRHGSVQFCEERAA